MNAERLTAKASIQIQKTPEKVYNAIVDPELMSKYFISKGSGLMETDQTLMWQFPEFDLEFPVRIVIAEKYRQVNFKWGEADEETLVEITIEPFKNDTVVKVTEYEPARNEAGVSWATAQTEGWSYFLAGLKAFLDHQVGLRKGAFEYRFAQ